MKRAALALALLAFSGAHVLQAFGADAPARPGKAIKNEPGVSQRADGSYHVAYMRRGCHVEEDWDGVNYSAQVRCQPGVKPN